MRGCRCARRRGAARGRSRRCCRPACRCGRHRAACRSSSCRFGFGRASGRSRSDASSCVSAATSSRCLNRMPAVSPPPRGRVPACPAPPAPWPTRRSRRCRARAGRRWRTAGCAGGRRRPRPGARARRRPAAPGPHDGQLALAFGVVEPVVQAAPLDRVVQLARAVAGEDGDRRRHGAHRADLGNADLVLAQVLQQEGLEGLVGAVHLVDQQHGAGFGRLQRLQQRAADQVAVLVDLALDWSALSLPSAARMCSSCAA
jgi:hypothetical protein